jgi:hypothetical protein
MGGSQFKASLGKVSEILSQKTSLVGWFTTVISSTQMMEEEDYGPRPALGKSMRTNQKNKPKQKKLVAWLKWWSTCQASTKS